MPAIRYTVSDLPPSKVAAFTPLPTMDGEGASFGLVSVIGTPGTQPVPAPNPMDDLPSVSGRKGVNSARPSDVAPADVFLPILYVAETTNQGPQADGGLGMWRRRFCELPIPALNPTRIPTSDTLVTAKGTRTTQAWPRAFQRFPTA